MFSALHVRIAASFIPFRAVSGMCHPSLHLLSQTSAVLWLPDIRWNVSQFLHRLILSTLSGYVRISAVPITHLRESLFTSESVSPCSQTGGCLTDLAFIGQWGIVCYQKDGIDQFPLNNDFPAQSLHLRYGSAAPCPTLKAYVTSSLPRTWYGRLATPYPTGLPCCDVISLQRPLARSVENSFCYFRSSHHNSIILSFSKF